MNWIDSVVIATAAVVCLAPGFYIIHSKRLAKAVAKAAEQAWSEGYEAGLGIVLAPHSMHELPRDMYVYLRALLLPEVDANLWVMRRIGNKSEDQLMTRLIHEEFPGKPGEAFIIDDHGTFRQPPHHKIERPVRNGSTTSRREPPPLKVTAPPPAPPPPAAPAAGNGSGAASAADQPRETFGDRKRREARERAAAEQVPASASG